MLSLGLRIESLIFYLFILLLPTQICKHFWPPFSQVLGVRVDYLSPALYITDLLVLILFIFWIKRKIFNLVIPARPSVIPAPLFVIPAKAGIPSSHQNTKTKTLLSLLIIFPYLLFTILLSGHLFPGLYQLVKVIELFFLGFYIAERVKTKNELSLIIMIASIGVIGESLLAIAQYIHQSSLNGLFYFLGERRFTSSTPGIANASINGQLILRPYATFPHPNALAGYLLCMLIMIFLVSDNKKDNIKKIIKTLALLLGQIALLLTLSRTAILLWMILLSSVLVVKIKNSTKKKLPVALTALLVLILVFSFLAYTPALTRLEETTLTEQAFTQRIDLTKNALTLIAVHPLFGVGLGNYLPAVAVIQKPLSTLYIQPVHNIFLLLLSEIGIIGLLSVLAFLFKTYQRLKNPPTNNIKKILLIVLSVILILGLFDHYWLTLQQNQLLLTVILGLSWAL